MQNTDIFAVSDYFHILRGPLHRSFKTVGRGGKRSGAQARKGPAKILPMKKISHLKSAAVDFNDTIYEFANMKAHKVLF